MSISPPLAAEANYRAFAKTVLILDWRVATLLAMTVFVLGCYVVLLCAMAALMLGFYVVLLCAMVGIVMTMMGDLVQVVTLAQSLQYVTGLCERSEAIQEGKR